MVCETITNILSIADLLVYPTTCDYFFYLKILGAVMLIVAWTLYKSEEKRIGKGDFLGSLAVSSIAITILASLGTLIKSTADIPMIKSDILLYLIAVCSIFVIIWIFKE